MNTTVHVRGLIHDLTESIAIWCLNPKCPWCGQRTPQIEAHFAIDHAGDLHVPHYYAPRERGES